MKMESPARSGAQMSNESSINKVGKYSNLKGNKLKDDSKVPKKKASHINCFNCGSKISWSITNHKRKCPAKTHICCKCQKKGHFKKVCRSVSVNSMIPEEVSPNEESIEVNTANQHSEDLCSVNLFGI